MNGFDSFDPFDPFHQDFVEMKQSELELNKLATELKRTLEDRLGYRLSLVTIDTEKKVLNVFHLPSSNLRMIEYADKVAAELYEEHADRIEEILALDN